MSKINMLPVVVRQMVESVSDPTTPAHVKHNYVQTLDAIVDVCADTVKSWRDAEALSLQKNKRVKIQRS